MFRLVIKGDLGFEVWQDIPGHEGLYQASTYGRIKDGEHIKRLTQNNGYLCTMLQGKAFKVHRIIALTFLPSCQYLPCINHKDENKLNNRVENLEWCDHAYNNNYGTRNKRISEANSGKSKTSEHRENISRALKNNPKISRQVAQYDINGNLLNTFPSTREASRKTGVPFASVQACCAGKQKHSHNYSFEWV